MANAHKGEVELPVGDKTYKFCFSMNALCELEDRLGRSFTKILTELADREVLRMSTIRAVFWAGLRDHQPDITMEQAGSIMTAVGFMTVNTIIEKAVSRSFPEGKEAAASDGPLETPARLNG